ncbi:CHASE3 domain-containing protein [Qipengyuania sp. 1NDH17]|uniref:histidine kinase n=1 Tax=Qipengyuania polymorpha TaxID=2867234 RepID=A0ABS7IVP7_9SPHN|nr:sensor histidine kinase [Qipengyuania polymorpha]MBX7457333.1 CHASE3 domain-containing protein [Qipengyuania polymorpha]
MTDSVRRRYEAIGRRRVLLLLGVGLALLATALITAFMTLGAITEDTDAVEKTLERQASIDSLATFSEQIAVGRRGFLLQPDPLFARTVREASSDFESEQARLADMLVSVEQRDRLEEIRELNAERTVMIDAMFADPEAAVADADTMDFNTDGAVLITQDIREIAEEMSAAESRTLVERNRAQLDSLLLFYIVGGLSLMLLLGVLVTAVSIVLRYNRDLAAAQVSLREANTGLETAVQSRTAELIRANEEIQRFAYIVSHDLRSPLVNVLGFTSELDEARKIIHAHLEELYANHPDLRDEEAWLAVDEDLPEALGFIRTSTEKMDRLINSILELSRQGRRKLQPEELDMEELVEDIVDSLYQRTEDAGATIEVKSIPELESDRIAVEQILQNLIENAIKYLSPERAGKIVVEGSKAVGTVRIDVIDNGRGIAPEDHERIFELFRRAGTQDQEGEGLGLANVRALAYRLGGTIEVDSELGKGSRFRLSLPAKFIAQEALA